MIFSVTSWHPRVLCDLEPNSLNSLQRVLEPNLRSLKSLQFVLEW